MVPQNYALPPGSLVLVTGANGFIASHIVDNLLKLGYNVRGTVRESRYWLDEFFRTRYNGNSSAGRFESFTLPDVGDDLESAFEGVNGVVHVAYDLSMNPNAKAVIPKQLAIIENLLTTANKFNVKRFVLTSTFTTATFPSFDQDVTITKDTWNEYSLEAAWSPKLADGLTVYAASRTEVERYAWKWTAEHKPSFVFNAVLPNLVIGKRLAPGFNKSSMGLVADVLSGVTLAMNFVQPQWFIDVQDNARLHVAALLSPAVSSERLFGQVAKFRWTEILGLYRQHFPDNDLIPEDPVDEKWDRTDPSALSARSENLIKEFFERDRWTTLEECIESTVGDF